MAGRPWQINTKDRKCVLFQEKEEKSWKEPFFFVQGADSQFGFISVLANDSVIVWDEEKRLANALVEKINKMQPAPKFFIICGDLIHEQQDSPLRDPQEKDFKEIFGKVRADIPLVCVCGNHDVGNTPTPSSVERYKSSFGDDYYSFYCGGLLFVVINSQYLLDPSEAQTEAENHAKWFEDLLVEAKKEKARIVIFQHIAWFVESPTEERNYFSLPIDVRNLWLPKIKDAGVEAIFCGHYHRNAGGFYEGIPVVVTSAIGAQLGTDKSGCRIVKVAKDAVSHEYYAINDLPLDNSK